MILKKFKKEIKSVIKLNKLISTNNLTLLNFGNASYRCKKTQKIFIKGSGFDTSKLDEKKISICKINNNKFQNLTEKVKPSVDTWTHYYIYKNIKNVNYIIHSHPTYSTVLAQAGIEPECLGTTHADYFKNAIPLSKKITKLKKNYELQIGETIVETLKKKKIKNAPGILARNHGLYAWGDTLEKTINNAVAIEFICKLYYLTKTIGVKKIISKNLKNFHFDRKNSSKKYYGQSK